MARKVKSSSLLPVAGLDSPPAIQAFLDEIPYSADPFYRCPHRVAIDRKAHCFDGAVFAAAALRQLGFQPLLMNLFAERDDDHVIALYKVQGAWGAVAKSNFVGLRFREPVYQSHRELAMSYFADYYNVAGEKTLRSHTVPMSLNSFDRYGWLTQDPTMEMIAARLDKLRRIPLLTPAMIENLSPMDKRSYEAGMSGVVPEGLYKPLQLG